MARALIMPPRRCWVVKIQNTTHDVATAALWPTETRVKHSGEQIPLLHSISKTEQTTHRWKFLSPSTGFRYQSIVLPWETERWPRQHEQQHKQMPAEASLERPPQGTALHQTQRFENSKWTENERYRASSSLLGMKVFVSSPPIQRFHGCCDLWNHSQIELMSLRAANDWTRRVKDSQQPRIP